MFVQVNQLEKQFKDHQAVKKLLHCIIRSKWSGKTITLHMLAGLLSPTKGSISYNGEKKTIVNLLALCPSILVSLIRCLPWNFYISSENYLLFLVISKYMKWSSATLRNEATSIFMMTKILTNSNYLYFNFLHYQQFFTPNSICF
jgi:ABC-type proline/glycine betaine transport system ATPase subunit